MGDWGEVCRHEDSKALRYSAEGRIEERQLVYLWSKFTLFGRAEGAEILHKNYLRCENLSRNTHNLIVNTGNAFPFFFSFSAKIAGIKVGSVCIQHLCEFL